MERETEPMAEAPSVGPSPTRKWGRQSQDLWSADAQLTGACQGHRGNPRSAAGKACKARKPDSTRGRVGSYSGRGAAVELGNPPAFPPPRGRMAEATGERAQRGRSLRSSPRTGKPSAWPRQAVGTTCKQEMDSLVRHGEYRVYSRHAAQAVSVGTPRFTVRTTRGSRPRMESRMRGNSHVRFGAGDEETCPGNGARRFIPTLLKNTLSLPYHRRPGSRCGA
jgi:hypothetical protein